MNIWISLILLHKVETFVGLKSIINTQRPGERDSLLTADTTEAVAVAGLLEKQDGRIELFYALVYTPE